MHLPHSSRDFSRRAVVLIFAVLLIIGLLSGLTYPMSVDENTEYNILKSNLSEYILRIFGEDSAFYRFLGDEAQPISQSIERDHGISAYYLIAPFCVLFNRISRHAMMLLWHSWTFTLFMVGVCSIYGIARSLFRSSRRFGCAAALMLYLTPRMFAEGHYNNKDLVLLSLTLLVIYLGIRFLQKNRLRDAALFSIAGAFATNTKIIGAWTWGVLGLLFLLSKMARKELNSRTWRNGLVAIVVFILGYVALTPASWSNPLDFLAYLLGNAMQFSRWKMFVLFEGETASYYFGETLPWYYLPKLMLMTIPIPVLLLSAAGLIVLLLRTVRFKFCTLEERESVSALLAITLSSLVPLLIGMFSSMVVYNGWRHFYFVYGPLLLLCIYTMQIISRALGNRNTARRIVTGLLVAYMGYHGIALAVNHPLQGSYFNPIAAQHVAGRYETDYWLLSTGPAVDGILKHAAANPEIEPICTANPLASSMVSRSLKGLPTSEIRYTNVLDDANYYIVNHCYDDLINNIPADEMAIFSTHYYQQYGLSEDESPVLGWNENGAFEELFTLHSYGIKICTVYLRTQWR